MQNQSILKKMLKKLLGDKLSAWINMLLDNASGLKCLIAKFKDPNSVMDASGITLGTIHMWFLVSELFRRYTHGI